MTQTVTVSQFREKLADYIDFLISGGKIELTNGRKGKKLLTLAKEKEEDFDWDEYMDFLDNFEPFWTNEDTKSIQESRKITNRRMKKYDF